MERGDLTCVQVQERPLSGRGETQPLLVSRPWAQSRGLDLGWGSGLRQGEERRHVVRVPRGSYEQKINSCLSVMA